jgi:hypothetical protein
MDKYEYGYNQVRDGNSPTGFKYSIYIKDKQTLDTEVEDVTYDTMAEITTRLIEVRKEGALKSAKEFADQRRQQEQSSRLYNVELEERRRGEETRRRQELLHMQTRARTAMANIDAHTFGDATERRRKEEKPTISSLQKEVKTLTGKMDLIIEMLNTGLTSGDIAFLDDELQIEKE